MEKDKLIATLTAMSDTARQSFRDPINAAYQRPAGSFGSPSSNVAALYLTTDNRPIRPVGFNLGSDRTESVNDIVIRSPSGYTDIVCTLECDWLEQTLAVWCRSPLGVRIGPWGLIARTRTLEAGERYELQDKDTISVVGGVQFQLRIPDRSTQRGFEAQWARLLGGVTSMLPADVPPKDSSLVIWLERWECGGAQGDIYSAVSLAVKTYAVKFFGAVEKRMVHAPHPVQVASPALEHPHIVKLCPEMRLAHEASEQCVVMEWAPWKDLFLLFDKLDQRSATHAVHQVLSALEYCHGRGIAHRNVTPGNVLFMSLKPVRVKLADFGVAGWGPFSTSPGLSVYAAPELLRDPERTYPLAADMWSLGIIIVELVSGERPCLPPAFGPGPTLRRPEQQDDGSWNTYMRAVDTTPYRCGWGDVWKLATSMLHMEPTRRASAKAGMAAVDQVHVKHIRMLVRLDLRRRAMARTVCLSGLMDYAGMRPEQRDALLRETVTDENSYHFVETNERYVAGEAALAIVSEHMPLLHSATKMALEEGGVRVASGISIPP